MHRLIAGATPIDDIALVVIRRQGPGGNPTDSVSSGVVPRAAESRSRSGAVRGEEHRRSVPSVVAGRCAAPRRPRVGARARAVRLPAAARRGRDGDAPRRGVAGDVRTVIDVTIRRSESGDWQLLLGGKAGKGVAPDARCRSTCAWKTCRPWCGSRTRIDSHARSTACGLGVRRRGPRLGARLGLDAPPARRRRVRPARGVRSRRNRRYAGSSTPRDDRGQVSGVYVWLRVRATTRLAGDAFAGFVGMCRASTMPPIRARGLGARGPAPGHDGSTAHGSSTGPSRHRARDRPAHGHGRGRDPPPDCRRVGRPARPVGDRDDEIVLAVHEAVTNCVATCISCPRPSTGRQAPKSYRRAPQVWDCRGRRQPTAITAGRRAYSSPCGGRWMAVGTSSQVEGARRGRLVPRPPGRAARAPALGEAGARDSLPNKRLNSGCILSQGGVSGGCGSRWRFPPCRR